LAINTLLVNKIQRGLYISNIIVSQVEISHIDKYRYLNIISLLMQLLNNSYLKKLNIVHSKLKLNVIGHVN